jgi:hypothetical protein
MRGRFTCEVARSDGGIRKVHLQSNGSGAPSEIVINAPSDMFDDGGGTAARYGLQRRYSSHG